ncbi:hypothetical protein R84981_002838 [Carnimonas sp. R-84981]|uniref:hypothetical protein n=1 Tax=Carnimonas bestiolae TaxID=3402172 RepID=UPI003EDC45C8
MENLNLCYMSVFSDEITRIDPEADVFANHDEKVTYKEIALSKSVGEEYFDTDLRRFDFNTMERAEVLLAAQDMYRELVELIIAGPLRFDPEADD